jgi:mannan endo-1,4-beta-mannosidase
MLLAYEHGGINTLCWHQYDPGNRSFYYDQVNEPVVITLLPGGENHEFYKNKLKKIAGFVKALRGPLGESVPIIFRPYHEQNGSWFWWGKGHRTEQEYIDLWQFTTDYLKNTLGIHNFIYAFSPDGNQYENKDDYLIDYPGDDYVDILGVDFYFGKGDSQEVLRFQRRLIDAVQFSQEKAKLAALTEVGDRFGWDDTDKLEIDRWFTRCLLYPIKTSQTAMNIAYAAVWRNDNVNHHFAPYPGHASVTDFMAFYNDPSTVFADEMANYYVLASGL